MTSPGGGPADTMARTAEPVRAIVYADGIETEYLRIGSGRPILLLALDEASALDIESFARMLAPVGRVVAPLAPARPTDGGRDRWLVDFLDGVGCIAPRVVLLGGSATIGRDAACAAGVPDHDVLWLAESTPTDLAAALRFITDG